MIDGKIDTTFDFTSKGLGELKSWLEPWWQQKSTGGGGSLDPSLIVTNIGDLGVPVDGKQGLLRIGPAQYNFVPVFYDATFGHWVSHEHMAWHSEIDIAVPLVGYTGNVGAFHFPSYRYFVAAGLVPQFRIFGHGRNSFGPMTGNNLHLVHWQISSGVGDIDPIATSAVCSVGESTVDWGFDSGWATLNAPATPKDILLNTVQVTVADVAHPDDVLSTYSSVRARWISQ